jgi:hypothetical protein
MNDAELIEAYELTDVDIALRTAKFEEAVAREIIFASGKFDPVFQNLARVGRVFGTAGAVYLTAKSIWEIKKTPEGQKFCRATQIAADVGGGFAGASVGGVAGGALSGLACGPGMPLCSVTFAIGGGLAGQQAGARLAEEQNRENWLRACSCR